MTPRCCPFLPSTFAILFAVGLSTSSAQPGLPSPGEKAHPFTRPVESLQDAAAHAVSVRLIVENESSLVPGAAGTLALAFDIAPGWHLYWHNPGDSGFPITWTIDAPPAITLAEPQWPVPQRHLSPGDILDYIYEHETTILIPFVVSTDFKPGDPLTLTADVQWLVCREGCVPGGARASLTIPASPPRDGRPAGDDSQHLQKAIRRLPRPLTEAESQWLATEWQGQTLRIKAQDARGMAFYPYGSAQAVPFDLVRRGMTTGDALEIPYRTSVFKAERVQGVVEVNRGGQTRYYSLDLPTPTAH